MAFFGKKSAGAGGASTRRLHDVQYSAIKDTLRKKNKEKKAAAETIVTEQ